MANTIVGVLRANLQLDSALFKSGAAQALSVMDRLRGGFGRTETASTRLVSILKQVAIAAGTIAAISYKTDQAREIQNRSNLLGMEVEQYQSLIAAAEAYGVSGEKAGDIVRDALDKIGDYAQTGAGEMADFFKIIAKPQGLTAQDFLKLPPEQMLTKFQESLDKANLTTAEQVFYWEAIADEGSRMAPIFADGAAKLKQWQQFLQQSGAVMSGTLVSNLSRVKTGISGIGTIMSGWGNAMLDGISGPLASLLNELATLMLNATWIRDGFAAVGQAIGSALLFASQHIQMIVSIFAALVAQFTIVPVITAGITGLAAAFGAVSSSTLIFAGALKAVRAALISSGIGLIVVAIGVIVGLVWEWVDSVGGVSKALDIVGGYWDGLMAVMNAGIDGLGDMFNGLGNIIAGAFLWAFAEAEKGLATLLQAVAKGVNAIISGARNLPGMSDLKDITLGDGLALTADQDLLDAVDRISEGGASISDGASKLANATDALARNDALRSRAGVEAVKDEGLGSPPAGIPQNPTLVDPLAGLGTGTGTGNGGGGGGKSATNKYTDEVTKLRDEIDKLRATMTATDLQEKIWNNTKAAGVTANSAEGQSIAQLTTELEQLREKKDRIADVKDAFKTMFTSIVSGSASAKEALGQFLQSIASMFANAAFEAIWTKLIAGTIFAFANGTPSVPAYATGTPATIPAYATGTASSIFMAGERGTELISAPVGSRVWTASQTKDILSGANQRGRVEIVLGPGLEANMLDRAASQSVSIVSAGIAQNNKQFNARSSKYNQQPRFRG